MTALQLDEPIEVGDVIDGYLDHKQQMVWLPVPMRILDARRAFVMAATPGGPLITFMSSEVQAVFDSDRTKSAIYLHRQGASKARWASFPTTHAHKTQETAA